ncbi:DEAD/DEAH box helicase [Alloalcanivorax venustensis]|uniref:DEAD/DEAH box helicase n=1 Tax=Alloalcanivorax venustensis TaxID=172371 RepID=UPI003C337CEE
MPVILKNRNTILKSETGSGKTLAYLVPLLEFLNGVALDALVVNGEHRFERRIAPPETRLPLLAD